MNKVILVGIFSVANLVVLSSNAAILRLPGETACQYYVGSNQSGVSIRKTTKSSTRGNFTGQFAGNIGSHKVTTRGDIGFDKDESFGRSIIYKKSNQVTKSNTLTVVVPEGKQYDDAKNLSSSEKQTAASYQCFHNSRA